MDSTFTLCGRNPLPAVAATLLEEGMYVFTRAFNQEVESTLALFYQLVLEPSKLAIVNVDT